MVIITILILVRLLCLVGVSERSYAVVTIDGEKLVVNLKKSSKCSIFLMQYMENLKISMIRIGDILKPNPMR